MFTDLDKQVIHLWASGKLSDDEYWAYTFDKKIPSMLQKPADIGHQLTDKELKKLERRISNEYQTAQKETRKKLRDYLQKTEEQRKIQYQRWMNKEITKKEYTDWCYRHQMVGDRWKEMLDTLAADYHNANEIALQIAKDGMPDIYALNCNYATYQLEHNGKITTGFTLYNHDTAEYLLKEQRQLMPEPSTYKQKLIAANKDMQWNKQKIQSAVLQGVLQGEDPYQVADRLMSVGQMNYNAAVRYARTMGTNAQNAGRYEAFHRATRLGVDLTIEWQATLDSRTRESHRLMHGQRREVDEPFIVTEDDGTTFEIMWPGNDKCGSSTVPQDQIWNCRCTLLSWVKGFEGDTVKKSPKMGEQPFEEWQNQKKPKKIPKTTTARTAREIFQAAQEFSTDYHEQNNFDRDKWDNLTDDERYGVRRYTGSSYGQMNRKLRTETFYEADGDTQKKIVGCTNALSNFTIADDTLLYRGMGDVSTLARAMNLSQDELIEAINDQSIIGMRFQEKGFCSTGVNSDSGWTKPVQMTIGAPKGTIGMYVDPISANRGEEELLLQQGTWFEILEASSRFGGSRVRLSVAVVDQTPVEYKVTAKFNMWGMPI